MAETLKLPPIVAPPSTLQNWLFRNSPDSFTSKSSKVTSSYKWSVSAWMCQFQDELRTLATSPVSSPGNRYKGLRLRGCGPISTRFLKDPYLNLWIIAWRATHWQGMLTLVGCIAINNLLLFWTTEILQFCNIGSCSSNWYKKQQSYPYDSLLLQISANSLLRWLLGFSLLILLANFHCFNLANFHCFNLELRF